MSFSEALAPTLADTFRAALQALRPRQWTKNLLVFAGLIFAGVSDEEAWLTVSALFVAYCAISSASYLINDTIDAPHDRAHPVKRNRPIARGALSAELACALAALLLATGIGLAATIDESAVSYACAFAALQLGYSTALKRFIGVDVAVIATLFVIRAAAGAAAGHVHISGWLLLCTALLALFLGLAKRRSELLLAKPAAMVSRPSLRHYSIPLVDALLYPIVAAIVVAYSAYAAVYAPHAHWMAATIPFVLLGIGRYLHLIRRYDLGEEPENLLIGDWVLRTTILLWAVTAVLVVGFR